MSTPELMHALRHDRVALMREAILWQRGIRLAALAAIVSLALAFGRENRAATLPAFVAVIVGYALVVQLTARAMRSERQADDRRVALVLVSADILTLGALVWLSSAGTEMARMLVPALLVVQLAAYYFGRGLGSYAATLATALYLLLALVLPSHVGGGLLETTAQALFTAGIFALVSALLVGAHARFRTRMNELRLFCKLVEEGDLAPALTVGADKRPDDLTLLARSFDAMRLRLAEQIGTDPLTGCLNRRALETRLRAEWRQAKRRDTTVALLGIDLDYFKQVNDTEGHPFGDLVLQELAGIFRATARDTDAVARLGGDEFVIVLPDTGWQGALTFAERVRRRVEDFSFGAESGGKRLTISVGVAIARGADPISPEMLLKEADRSLYKAKTGGRNRVFA